MTRVSIAPVAVVLALTTSACVYTTPYYRSSRSSEPKPAESSKVDHRLFLIGDAGDADPKGEPALDLLAQLVRAMPERTTVVFLGDNVYERGVPDLEPAILDQAAQAANVLLPRIFDSRREAERCLDAQMATVRGTAARAIFIPGNHDWDPLQAGGWQRVMNQQAFLESRALGNMDVSMLPGGGCPGPVTVPLGKRGALIVIDTQWFLESGPSGKPVPDRNPTNCTFTTEEAVASGLVAALERVKRQGRWAIVAGHHPLNTAGPHGGFADAATHLFPMRFLRHYVPWYIEWIPMPVLGSAMVFARARFSPSPQDSSNSANEHLRFVLRGAMAEAEKRGAPTLAYAGGHDHSLQVFKTAVGPRYTLVSGLGVKSRASEVGATHNTLFAHSHPLHPGFMQVDFLRDGHVRLSVVEADGSKRAAPGEVFSTMLADADTPRGARPVSRSGSVWSRVRKRAISAWRYWRGREAAEDAKQADAQPPKPDVQQPQAAETQPKAVEPQPKAVKQSQRATERELEEAQKKLTLEPDDDDDQDDDDDD